MSVSLPADKLLEIQQLTFSLFETQPVTVHHIKSFLGKANFCVGGCALFC